MSTSPYTGDVEVGGPADVRELPGLTISKLAVSEMANNAYLLRDTASGEALLIDAAAEPEALRVAHRRRRPAHRRHDARPLGPPPRAARGRRGDRRRDRRPRRGRRRPAGARRSAPSSTATP